MRSVSNPVRSGEERWVYHVLATEDDVGDPYSGASVALEGFLHASLAASVHETIALYFAADADLTIFQIDPRGVSFAIDIVDTPRGPMPHLPGPVPRSAVARRW